MEQTIFFIRSATLISVICLLSGDVEMHRRTCSLLKIFDGMGLFLWTLDSNKSELTRFGFALSGDSLFRQEAVNLDKDILRAL